MIGPAGFCQEPNTGAARGLSAEQTGAHEDPLSKQEKQEHTRLQNAWARGTATKKQILRCMELDRSAERHCANKHL